MSIVRNRSGFVFLLLLRTESVNPLYCYMGFDGCNTLPHPGVSRKNRPRECSIVGNAAWSLGETESVHFISLFKAYLSPPWTSRLHRVSQVGSSLIHSVLAGVSTSSFVSYSYSRKHTVIHLIILVIPLLEQSASRLPYSGSNRNPHAEKSYNHQSSPFLLNPLPSQTRVPVVPIPVPPPSAPGLRLSAAPPAILAPSPQHLAISPSQFRD